MIKPANSQRILENTLEGQLQNQQNIQRKQPKLKHQLEETKCQHNDFMKNQKKIIKKNKYAISSNKENTVKLQGKIQNKDIFLQFQSVDILEDDQKVDSLVFVTVQNICEEFFVKKVEQIQMEKMTLFGSLCHELRTPLNCSISMLEVLKDEVKDLNSQYVEDYLNPALFSNQLLLNQINDILDFVQIDKGKFKYQFQEFHIFGLFRDCQKLVGIQAQMKKLQIRINIDKGVPEQICSDPNRIRQILLNFLSNSLKFTKQGFIEVSISMFDNGIYKIAVQDTGIGIKQENLEEIFKFCAKVEELFFILKFQLTFHIKINYSENDEKLNTSGCGLGLYISNSIARGLVQNENIKSGVSVESDYGKGSVFSFLIQDQSYVEQFTRFSKVQSEETKMSIRALFKQVDEFQKTTTKSSIQKKRKHNTCKHSKQSVKNLKQNQTQYSLEEQNTLENEENSKLEGLSTQIQSNLNEIKKQKSMNQCNLEYQNQFDSSALIESEENINQIKYEFSQSFVKKKNVKFQEESEQRIQSQLSLTKAKSIKELSKQIQFQKTRTIDQIDTSQQCNTLESMLLEKHKTITSCRNRIISESESSQDSQAKNYNFYKNLPKVKSYSSMKNASLDKLSQKHEGFTSYTPFNKLNDIQITSSNYISSSIKKQNKIIKSLVKINSLSNDKYLSLSTLEIPNPQTTIDKIILNNISKQEKCGCPQILIIDDNQFNIYALSKTIQTFSFQSQSISDSSLVVDYIQNMYHQKCCQSPKLIFMDIEMPFKNGYQLSIEINQFYDSISYNDTPVIIACTAYVGQEDYDKAIQSGMSDFINKPLLKSAFQQLIINWQDLFL